MANDQNGELLMNDEGSAALDENEQKSSALGFLSNTDVLRQITLILGLAICLAIAVFILLWGKEPDMRPLAPTPPRSWSRPSTTSISRRSLSGGWQERAGQCRELLQHPAGADPCRPGQRHRHHQ